MDTTMAIDSREQLKALEDRVLTLAEKTEVSQWEYIEIDTGYYNIWLGNTNIQLSYDENAPDIVKISLAHSSAGFHVFDRSDERVLALWRRLRDHFDEIKRQVSILALENQLKELKDPLVRNTRPVIDSRP